VIGPFVKRSATHALIAGLSFGTIGFMINGLSPSGALSLLEFPSCRCGARQPGDQALMTR